MNKQSMINTYIVNAEFSLLFLTFEFHFRCDLSCVYFTPSTTEIRQIPSAETVALTPMRFYPAFNVFRHFFEEFTIYHSIYFFGSSCNNYYAHRRIFRLEFIFIRDWSHINPHIKNFILFNLSVSIILSGSCDTNQI